MRENWVKAYSCILEETKRDMPDADIRDLYSEYRSRCEAWKHERGIR